MSWKSMDPPLGLIFEQYCWSVHPRTLVVECMTHDLLIAAHESRVSMCVNPFKGPVFFGKGL